MTRPKYVASCSGGKDSVATLLLAAQHNEPLDEAVFSEVMFDKDTSLSLIHISGWYLRNDIIWMKDNPMPESVKDRCARCYEHIFLFSKSKKYFFDYKAISEPIAPATAERLKRGMKGGNKYGKPVPGQPQPQSINRPREHGEIKDSDINPLRNKRDVWKINTVPFKGGHYAAYPPKLVETCLLAGCPEGGIVLDPFMGSGTTGMVAAQMGRHFVGVELNPEYTELAYKRIGGEI